MHGVQGGAGKAKHSAAAAVCSNAQAAMLLHIVPEQVNKAVTALKEQLVPPPGPVLRQRCCMSCHSEQAMQSGRRSGGARMHSCSSSSCESVHL